MCQSKFREEAESKFEDASHNITVVKRFLDEKKESISYMAIRNHMNKHYLGEERLTSVKELLEDISNFSIRGLTGKQMLIERIMFLRREMFNLAAASDGLDIEERRKNADCIKKLSDGITGLECKIQALESEYTMVEKLFEGLNGLIVTKVKTTNSKEVKKALSDLLNEFGDLTQDVMIEDKD